MRQFLTLLTVLCLAFTVSPILAGPIADSLAFQGRLTDASDVPVPDGPRDLTISLWTDSVGGTMLHSEVVAVTVSKGLYSTCIGCASSSFFDIFTDQSVYLQVQLAGSPPMTPRTVMRSVPFSVSASSLHSHAALPGGAVLSAAVSSVGNLGGGGGGAAAASYARLSADSDGDGHDDFVITDSARTDGVHHVTGGDLDGDGSPDLGMDVDVKPIRVELKLYDDSDALQRSSVTQGASTDSANQMLSTDLDGDGIPDVVVASSVRPSHASLAIKTKGTSAQRLSAGGDCDDTDSEIYADCDDDNDGIVESRVSASSSSEGAAFSMHSVNDGMPNRISMNVTVPKQTQRCVIFQGSDSNLDGIDETSMASTVERKSGSIIYLDREGNEVVRSMVGVDSTRGVLSTDRDSDGDGVPEDEATLMVIPGTSSVAIKTKGTGADKNRTISGTCDDSSAVQVVEIDDDGDGIAEGKGIISVKSATGPSTTVSSRMSVDRDDNGTDDNDASFIVTPTTSSVAIQTKGTGADKNRTAGSSCDDSSAVDYLDIDDDADGISEVHAVSSVSSVAGGGGGGAAAASYAATGRWYADSDDDGVPEGDIDAIVTPTTNSVAIKTKGTGADANRSASITSTTEVGDISTVSAIDDDGDGLSDLSIEQSVTSTDVVVFYGSKKGYDYYQAQSQLRASLVMRDSTKDTTFFVDGDGRIGIGKPADAVKRIDVAGGAYCDGTTWANASDANAKENFQPVDGEELLEKISGLEITRWNYKGDSETEHIGPTAQDFQATFGVGSDGKSISTIDPSGIALAAIKQLKKENTELKKQIEELSGLKNEIEQLKKLLMEKK